LSATTALVEQKEQEILAPLNEQQKKPAMDFEGSSIILAGAGSGKTKTIVVRVQNMINHGIDPRNILVFTFTRKGAEEIRSRIIAGIGEEGKHVTMGTYHSFCARLLRQNIGKFEIWDKHFTIFDAEDSQKVLSDI
jgi:DNA helicase-2/ATP-dependent DNA helicase PcrA